MIDLTEPGEGLPLTSLIALATLQLMGQSDTYVGSERMAAWRRILDLVHIWEQVTPLPDWVPHRSNQTYDEAILTAIFCCYYVLEKMGEGAQVMTFLRGQMCWQEYHAERVALEEAELRAIRAD